MPPPLFANFAWNRRPCAGNPLNLSATLSSGQSFRWRKDAQGVWWGVVERTVVAAWQQEGEPDSPLYWQTFPERDRADQIGDYFRFNIDLETLYTDWSRAEPRIASALAAFRGLRVLRQPPEECFFAFQCAACNTVVKIERSVAHLAAHYGKRIEIGPISPRIETEPVSFYAFPILESLAAADEAVLRAGLWGYRAPRVIALARYLQSLSPGWLQSLRHVPYPEAHAALSGLYGVGAKLADCICLFALDKDDAAPIDTHIRQITVRMFRPDLAGKTLTPRVYTALADVYRERFGPYAGWAQQYLFFAQFRRANLLAC